MIGVRPAVPADLPRVMAVWTAAAGIEGDHTPLPLFSHEMATGLLMVAEDDDGVIGFGAVLERGGSVFLADLFVLPGHQSRGVGRALLEALYAPWPDLPRYTNASADPRARALYRRYGMEPRFEIDYLRSPGPVAIDTNVTHSVNPVSDAVIARDRQWTGIDRAPDLTYWSKLGAVAVTAFVGPEPTGHGFVFPRTPWVPGEDRTAVGQIVAAPEADPAQVVAAVFHAAAALPDRAGPTFAMIPRPHAAHTLLISAGMKVVDSDLFMAGDGAGFDPTRRTAAPDIN